MSNIIYYFGNAILIVIFSYIAYIEFKEYEEIDFNEHKWIILMYFLLLILSLLVWRIVFLIIKYNLLEFIEYQKIIKRIENG